MKKLRGHQIEESDYSDIEKQLKALFKKLVYDPILDLLAPHNAQVKIAAKTLKNSRTLKNAKYDAVIAGIYAGRIQYVSGTFSGEWNAALSKGMRSLGATFNKNTKTYSILPEQLPKEILDATKRYAEIAKTYHDELDDRLRTMQIELSYNIQENPIDADKTVSKMDKKFQEQYGDALGVGDLSAMEKAQLSRSYEQSLKPFIKKFTNEQIAELRSIVKANAETGYRFDRLISQIEDRFNVIPSKAEFLARQETSIYVSRARQSRFSDVGITEYIWRTSGDVEVRSGHKQLNGQTFNYSKKAPAQYMSCAQPCNPGEDFNCRCVAEPILPGVFAVA